MATPVRLIWSVADLLAVMRESPATRMVLADGKRDAWGRPLRAVVDWPDCPRASATVVAYVSRASAADDLIGEVIGSALSAIWKPIWERLPLRFHDGFGTCLLLEHPHAPCGQSASGSSADVEGADELTEEQFEEIGRGTVLSIIDGRDGRN
jgi:hypothetical protein